MKNLQNRPLFHAEKYFKGAHLGSGFAGILQRLRRRYFRYNIDIHATYTRAG